MVRSKRVLSFMSEWGGQNPQRKAPSAATSPATVKQPNASTFSIASSAHDHGEGGDHHDAPRSPTSQARPESRPSSRPMSMIQTYQPPVMQVGHDTLPELQRIFLFLNGHSNKLYQEGYFLKFHDTDTRGRHPADRVWQECFAQLVGTILSLWDASELDRVHGDAEVLPTFINLTDAAIHMMPSMVLGDGKRLENILSVSTAASNKYLFHFNSFNSLTQWTAGIRLAMYEHTSLQEAYTGALIAGKGRQLNNIRTLLDRQRAKYEDWVRVRFGAGTPWRRCWCVVSPPDEKEYAKLQKNQRKQMYNRSPVVLKGDIRFYDTKKVTKKTKPIASVKDAYSCFSIYPQSKQLIDHSTLVKLEGNVTIHSKPEKVTEGFVFVMPEARPAVSGFEIMLQFLFPVFDTFALYGRPTKLIADSLDPRGLMFAMPPDKRYGYLEMWDVVSLIHADGSQAWSERQWRKQLKDLTSKCVAANPRTSMGTRPGTRRNTLSRASMAPSRAGTVRFDEPGAAHSQPATRQTSPTRNGDLAPRPPARVDSAPAVVPFATPRHQRSVSEQTNGHKQAPSRLVHMSNVQDDTSPAPAVSPPETGSPQRQDGYETSDNEPSSPSPDPRDLPEMQIAPTAPPRGPVASPPTFAHAPGQRPPVQPQNPAVMKPNPQLDSATLEQLADATHTDIPLGVAAAGATAAWRSSESPNRRRSGDPGRGEHHNADSRGLGGDQHAQGPHQSARPGSRLPTIPASPFVEHEQFVDASTVYQPAPPPVPEHAELPAATPGGDAARTRPLSGHVQRKPVPGRLPASQGGDETRSFRSTTSSSLGSLRNDVVDPEALDRLDVDDAAILRQPSKSSSRYSHDDALSTSTPDYASTIEDEPEPRKASARVPERPRSGMLKLVGDPSLNPKSDVVVGDARYAPAAKSAQSDVPAFDFGPTYSLDPTATAARPSTSGTMTRSRHNHSLSRSSEILAPMSDEHRPHPYSGRTTPTMASHMYESSSPQQTETRSMAWQPGMASHPHHDRQQLEADEWVAQRASSPHASMAFTHARAKSHTPPMSRAHSGDWTHQTADTARPPSRPLSRPHSRGAERLLDQHPTTLSAREQEQVARLTGTPLIDLSRTNKHQQKPSASGLTAYIDSREKERAASKSSRGTTAMQAEIDRRMQVAQQRQMLQMQQMGQQIQMGPQPGTPQGYPPAFAYSSPSQMQQMYQQQQQQQQQQQGYFQQQGMQQGWGGSSPQPVQGQYYLQHPVMPPLQPATQPYGASYDQAQAAARHAHQQGRYRRQ